MYRPFLSYSLAIIFYGLLILLSFLFYRNHQPQPMISLQIEALIANQANHIQDHQHEFSKKISSDQNTKLRHQHQHLEGKKQYEKKYQSQHSSAPATNLAPLYQPLPDIPEELRYEAMRTKALARFNIATDGTVKSVDLIQPSNSPKLNYLLIKSLKQWRFEASNHESSQEISITFEVK